MGGRNCFRDHKDSNGLIEFSLICGWYFLDKEIRLW